MNAARPTLRFHADVARQGRQALGKEMYRFEQYPVSYWGKTLADSCFKK
jgi:hypothetical protein